MRIEVNWRLLVVLVVIPLLGIMWWPTLQVLGESEAIAGEWMSLDWANRILTNGHMYLSSDGFVEGGTPTYTPMYYHLFAGGISLFGGDAIPGRVTSFVFLLIIALSVSNIAVTITKKWWIGLLAVILVCLHPVLRDDSTALRPDIMALGLTILGFSFVVRKEYWWSLPLFVLAIFTKQSYLAAPVAVGIWLLIKDRRLAVKWGLVLVAGILAVFIPYNIWTSGELFKHVILYPLQSGEIMYTAQFTLVSLLLLIVPFLFSVGYLIYYKDWGPVSLYFLVSLVVMVVLIGKDGAGVNYSFELVVASCILMSLFFSKLLTRKVEEVSD